MITYAVRAFEAGKAKFSFQGASTDTKPTGIYNNMGIANASTFFELDTQDVYFYDGANDVWFAQP